MSFEKKNSQKYNQKRLDNELILKQWILENPEKAKIWYAHVSHSTNLKSDDLDSFIEILGVDDENINSQSKYRNFYTEEAKKDPYYKCQDGIYYDWEIWIEEYEEYQEFKIKAPEKWQQLKESKYRVYINDAAQELLKYSTEHKHTTFAAHEILSKWINHNQELWKEIRLRYVSAIKTDEEYLFQAWMEFFSWDDTFTVWKLKNPSLWEDFKKECAYSCYSHEGYIKSIWRQNHDEEWRLWKEKYAAEWNKHYEKHKELLWYAYIEETWAQLSESKKIEITKEEDVVVSENPDMDLYYPDADIMCEIEDFSYEIENHKELEYYIYHSPRYQSEKEDDIHDLFINRYKNDTLCNPKKHSYLAQTCSQYGLEQFIKPRYFFSKEIETPECYANRRILDIWIKENKEEWINWKSSYYWNEKYKDLRYEWKEYYEVWKSLYIEKWKEWIEQCFEQWKRKAQEVDLWFAWLSDNNELAFHQWASLHLRSWKNYMDKAMEWDLYSAYSSLFGYSCSDLKQWKENNPEEWNFWKDFIEEKLYMIKFKEAKIQKPYIPEFKLKLEIDKLRFQAKCGKNLFHEHLAILYCDGKYGYIDETWKVIIPIKYDYALDFSDGTAIVKETKIDLSSSTGCSEKWGAIDKKGNFIVNPNFDILCYCFGLYVYAVGCDYVNISNNAKDVIPITANGKWGILNRNGEILVNAKYDRIQILDNGMAIVNVGCCFMKILDEDSFWNNFNNYAYIGGKWGLLSHDGKLLTPIQYTYISQFNGDLAIVNVNALYNTRRRLCNIGGKWGLINKSGQIVVKPQFDMLRYKLGLYIYTVDSEFIPYEDNQNPAYNEFQEEISHYTLPINGKSGLLNNEGDVLVNAIYDRIKILENGMPIANIGYIVEWNEFGDREVIFDGEWCLLSKSGVPITPVKYSHISDFNKGLAIVNIGAWSDDGTVQSYIGGEWGYINENGEEIMPLIKCNNYQDFIDKVTYLDYLDTMAQELYGEYNNYENWLIDQKMLEEERMRKDGISRIYKKKTK